jgi:outer membrane protein insertion porin family
MSARNTILLVLFAIAFSSYAQSQSFDEKDQFRWLQKKPTIDSIIISIDCGPKVDSFFNSRQIYKVIFSRTSNIFRAIKSDRRRRVHRESLARDTSGIKHLYLSNGFLGVKIEETFHPNPADSNSSVPGAIIKINVVEGNRFLYRYIRINGEYDSEYEKDFGKILNRLETGTAVNPFKLREAAFDIKSILANNGYPYAKVDYTIDTLKEHSYADIDFSVKANSKVYFGNVLVDGATNFDVSLAQREITINKGEIYRRKDVISTQKRLLESGYYLTMQLNPISTDTADRLNPDFILKLKEKKPHFISIKTGASQDSLKDLTWTFSASWGKRNLLRSRRLELTASSSFIVFTEWRVKEHNYRIRITEPWFMGIRMPMTLTGQFSPGVRTPIEDQDYRKQSWSISISTLRNIRDQIKILTGLQYAAVNIYGLSEEDQEILKQEEGIRIQRKLFFDITRDSRNNIFIPSVGSLTNLNGEYVGGFLNGDDSYFMLQASWARYQKVWPGWISATRFKYGYVREFGESENVPVDDRFYIGGANTIRGFSQRGLGPQLVDADGNLTPEGANIILIANHEFRFRVIGNFWSSLFFDIGNGFRSRFEIKLDRLAYVYGMGIQFLSPAGPLRLDYARRIKTNNIEFDDRFHITILYAF